MHVDVLTLFPNVFEEVFSTSIIGRAVEAGIVSITRTDIRAFSSDKHRSVDDRPFGGGPGMVLMCDPVFRAVESVEAGRTQDEEDRQKPYRILLTPQGEPLRQETVVKLAAEPWLVVLCGHYEGFDERIREGFGGREVSIGDFVVSGGETAAMVLLDAVVRLLPGALGGAGSSETDTFSDGLLEYPQYTRPRSFRGMNVPDVLLSGDHGKIAAWRDEQRLNRTRMRRPDLLEGRPPETRIPDGRFPTERE